MSNSRRAAARQPQPSTMRHWPAYSRQATAQLRESAAAPAPVATVEVSNKAWSQFTQADYTVDQWRRACLLDTGEGDPDTKQRYKLPVREPGGDLNRNAVHAAAGGRGIHAVEGISDELRRDTARKIVRLYRDELDEEPTDGLLDLAGMAESHPGPQPAQIQETVPAAIREAPGGNPLTVDVQLIEAGWNKPGTRWYPPDVLARDIPKVYPRGTHMYLDHPTVSEEMELPERSVTRLAAVLASDPYTTDGGRTMRATARVFAPHREFVTEAWRDIGLSINGDGHGQPGEREGRKGLIIEALTHGRSVDFVTRPGAGGRIVQLLESATHVREARNVGAWLEARIHQTFTAVADGMYGEGRLNRDERITLSHAIGDALAAFVARVDQQAPGLNQRDPSDEPDNTTAADDSGSGSDPGQVREATADEIRQALHDAVSAFRRSDSDWTFVDDFDPDQKTVWWSHIDDGQPTMWQQSYRIDDQGQAQLGDDRVEVRRRIVYEPVEQQSSAAESAAEPARQSADGHPPAATPTQEGVTPMAGDNTQTGATPEPAGAAAADGLSPEARAQIAESQLREAQARITTLESEKATVAAERDTARGELNRMRLAEAARGVVDTTLADSDLPTPARTRVTESVTRDVPTSQDGQLDSAALTNRINEAVSREREYIAAVREAAGEGAPNGLGTTSSTSSGEVDVAKVRESLAEVYQKRGLSPEAAKLAAAGRN